jgi:hypothetical protein
MNHRLRHSASRGVTRAPKIHSLISLSSYWNKRKKIDDQFATDAAAPLTSPRTAVPGPGTLNLTTAASLSTSGGKLIKGGAFVYAGSQAIARGDGLAIYARNLTITATSGNSPVIGFSNDGAVIKDAINPRTTVSTIQCYDNGTLCSYIDRNLPANSTIDVLVIARPTKGALMFVRGSMYGKWRLVYVSDTDNTATLFPFIKALVTDNGWMDDVKVYNLGGLFATDFGFAHTYQASPSSPVNIASGPNAGIVEITWTPQANEIMELTLKKIDDDNKIIMRCNQAAGTCDLIQKLTGSESTLQTKAQTWTIGTAYRVWARFQNTSVYNVLSYVNTTVMHTKTIDASLSNATIYGASGFTVASNFAIWDSLKEIGRPFDYDFENFRWFYSYGDSKTYARLYQAFLQTGLETATGRRWMYGWMGIGGYTVAQMKALIDTHLAAITGNIPEAVIINLGTNDLPTLPDETAWKTNYRYIIAAFHAKWPNAKIYLAKPVRLSATPPSSPVAATSTLHQWIDDLIAEQTYVYEGIDETDLENSDQYVTYFADAAHPNEAGYAKGAEYWQTAMGF